jgi:hypothetical protein
MKLKGGVKSFQMLGTPGITENRTLFELCSVNF